MGKYEPLEIYLLTRQADEVAATFAEIESIIGARLPNTAHTHRAWWSNNPSNNVMTKSWLSAGYQTERVDMTARKLVFRRRGNGVSSGRAGGSGNDRGPGPVTRALGPASKSILERLWGTLAGTAHIPDGVDLAEPTDTSWDAERS